MNGPIPYDPSASVTDQVSASLRTSLTNLHTTYLDSYVLHSPLSTLRGTLEAWRALIAAQDEGLVRVIGVSNAYSPDLLRSLEEATDRAVQVVQNRWYEGNAWDTRVFSYCQEKKIQYQYDFVLLCLSAQRVLTIANKGHFGRSLDRLRYLTTEHSAHSLSHMGSQKLRHSLRLLARGASHRFVEQQMRFTCAKLLLFPKFRWTSRRGRVLQ
jgi:aryl-alcohol dehydrogenase-like predicted oxidoreductase